MKRLRTMQGMTQAQFAQLMQERGWSDFTQAVVSRLENGQRPLTLTESRAVAEALETPVEKMLNPVSEDYVKKVVEGRVRDFRFSKQNLRDSVSEFMNNRDIFFSNDTNLSETDNLKVFLELSHYIEELEKSTMWDVLLSAMTESYTEMVEESGERETALSDWTENRLGVKPHVWYMDWTVVEAKKRLEAINYDYLNPDD